MRIDEVASDREAKAYAVTFAAGVACEGMKPVVAIYSTFLQRAYDSIVHDAAIQDLPVVLCLDRAGLVGEDGETHAGLYDIAYMLAVPSMTVTAPIITLTKNSHGWVPSIFSNVGVFMTEAHTPAVTNRNAPRRIQMPMDEMAPTAGEQVAIRRSGIVSTERR